MWGAIPHRRGERRTTLPPR